MMDIGIIGYGRFGKVLEELLANDEFNEFSVKIFDLQTPKNSLEEVLACKNIFIAVPIRNFAQVIAEIAPKLSADTTIIDVCSVKVYPVHVMKAHLPKTVGLIATHPLFGPDSLKSGYKAKIMMDATRDLHLKFNFWQDVFSRLGLEVLIMTPEQHDQLAAESQGITHFIGRVLHEAEAKSTPIDTAGYKKLLEVMSNTCNDSWELFIDLQKYNPYSQITLEKLLTAVETVYQQIKNTRVKI